MFASSIPTSLGLIILNLRFDLIGALENSSCFQKGVGLQVVHEEFCAFERGLTTGRKVMTCTTDSPGMSCPQR